MTPTIHFVLQVTEAIRDGSPRYLRQLHVLAPSLTAATERYLSRTHGVEGRVIRVIDAALATPDDQNRPSDWDWFTDQPEVWSAAPTPQRAAPISQPVAPIPQPVVPAGGQHGCA